MATPLVAGLSMAGAALLARQGLLSYAAWRAAAPVARAMRDKGAFKPTMDRLEAAKILGVRESATPSRIRLAHQRVIKANHPDAGGSDFIASKVNEAKDLLLRRDTSTSSF